MPKPKKKSPAKDKNGATVGYEAQLWQMAELVLPPEHVAHAFTKQVQPWVDRIITGIHESRTLAALRDALLPKLTSGELHVPNGQRTGH